MSCHSTSPAAVGDAATSCGMRFLRAMAPLLGLAAVTWLSGCGDPEKPGVEGVRSDTAKLTSANLMADPGFETSVSGFILNTASSIAQTTTNPITGGGSLRVTVAASGYGNGPWWSLSPAATSLYSKADAFSVSIDARANTPSTSNIALCLFAYYVGNPSTVSSCTNDPTTAVGTVRTVTATLALDSTQRLDHIAIRLTQVGSVATDYTFDNASAVLVATASPDAGTADAATTDAATADATTADATTTDAATTDAATTDAGTAESGPSDADAATGGAASPNLLVDPGFEVSTSGFALNTAAAAEQTTLNPIVGGGSLHVVVGANGYGNGPWWAYSLPSNSAFRSASSFAVSIDARANVASTSNIAVCVYAYYTASSRTASQCVNAVPTQVGTTTTVTNRLPLDPTQSLDRVAIKLSQIGNAATDYTYDSASAVLVAAYVSDAGSTDSGTTDSGTTDSGTTDSGTTDSGTTDSGTTDSGTTDSGTTDSGTTDSGTTDAGAGDSGVGNLRVYVSGDSVEVYNRFVNPPFNADGTLYDLGASNNDPNQYGWVIPFADSLFRGLGASVQWVGTQGSCWFNQVTYTCSDGTYPSRNGAQVTSAIAGTSIPEWLGYRQGELTAKVLCYDVAFSAHGGIDLGRFLWQPPGVPIESETDYKTALTTLLRALDAGSSCRQHPIIYVTSRLPDGHGYPYSSDPTQIAAWNALQQLHYVTWNTDVLTAMQTTDPAIRAVFIDVYAAFMNNVPTLAFPSANWLLSYNGVLGANLPYLHHPDLVHPMRLASIYLGETVANGVARANNTAVGSLATIR